MSRLDIALPPAEAFIKIAKQTKDGGAQSMGRNPNHTEAGLIIPQDMHQADVLADALARAGIPTEPEVYQPSPEEKAQLLAAGMTAVLKEGGNIHPSLAEGAARRGQQASTFSHPPERRPAPRSAPFNLSPRQQTRQSSTSTPRRSPSPSVAAAKSLAAQNPNGPPITSGKNGKQNQMTPSNKPKLVPKNKPIPKTPLPQGSRAKQQTSRATVPPPATSPPVSARDDAEAALVLAESYAVPEPIDSSVVAALCQQAFSKLQRTAKLRVWRDTSRMCSFLPHSQFSRVAQQLLLDYLNEALSNYEHVCQRVEFLCACTDRPISLNRLVVMLITLEGFAFYTHPDLLSWLESAQQPAPLTDGDIDLSAYEGTDEE